jgi:cell division septation protein DedD
VDTGQDDPTGLPASAASLYRAALGPAGARTHLSAIARFEQRGRSAMAWNTRAALGQLAWLVYWRLWDAVLAQAGLALAAAAGLGWLWLRADGVPMGVRVGVTASVAVLWCALPGLWGLAWLHRGLRDRVASAVEEADSFPAALERLERSEAGWRIPGLVASVAVTLAVALLAGVVWQLWRAPAVAGMQGGAQPRPVPSLAGSAGVPSAQAAQPPVLQPPVSPPPVEPVVVESAAASAPVAATAVEPVLRPRPRGFGVNVGMFAKEANAERVKSRLSEAGLPVLDDPIESARGPLTRVRVGPFERREEAEAAAVKVRALGLEARVYAP